LKRREIELEGFFFIGIFIGIFIGTKRLEHSAPCGWQNEDLEKSLAWPRFLFEVNASRLPDSKLLTIQS
jgi:hypothetical protein